MKRRVQQDEPEEDTTEAEAEDTPRRRSTARNGEGAREGRSGRRPSRAAAEDEEDTTPRGGRRRRPKDDDEDDEEDRSFKKPNLKGGWGRGDERKKQFGSEFPDEWRVETTERLLLLLEDEPFSSYGMHWIDEKLASTKKKGFICLEDNCPLCEIGDRPRAMYGFNVYVYTTEDDSRNAVPKGGIKILTCGNRLFDQLKDIHNSKREGPLSKYWRVFKRTGKGGSTGYSIETIKDEDLDEVLEEMDIEDLISDEELDELDLYDDEVIANQAWSPRRLAEVAAELT